MDAPAITRKQCRSKQEPLITKRPGTTRPSRPGTCAAGAGRLSSASKPLAFDNEIGAEHVRLRARRALRLRYNNTGVLFGAPVFCSWEGKQDRACPTLRVFIGILGKPRSTSHLLESSNECYSALICRGIRYCSSELGIYHILSSCRTNQKLSAIQHSMSAV